jgi:Flp pilus assembly pilin Flp
MPRPAISDPARALHVRTTLAGARARERLVNGLTVRLGEEHGAQAAEYAMLGGVSAAACGALITLLKQPKTMETVVSAVLSGLARAVRAWF